jgi:hypothetical protein
MNNLLVLAPFSLQRTVITRTVMVYCLLCLTLWAVSHTLPVQLAAPTMRHAGTNLTLIGYNISGLGTLLTRHPPAAMVFTVLLFAAPLLLLVFPRNVWLAASFSLLLFLFMLTTHVYVGHGQHTLFLLWLATLPFCFRADVSFGLLWEGVRYYACWLYFSAFIFKLINGSMGQWDHGLMVMQEQLAGYIFLNPGSALTLFYTWLMQHDFWVNAGEKLVYVAEGLFGIGFFTRRYDRLLIGAGVFIFITTTLFADVFFVEQMGILVLAFLAPAQWRALQNRLGKTKHLFGGGKPNAH